MMMMKRDLPEKDKNVIGDLLKIPVNGVDRSGSKVNDPLGDLQIHSLQIQDHRASRKKGLRDLPGVVHGNRLHHAELGK